MTAEVNLWPGSGPKKTGYEIPAGTICVLLAPQVHEDINFEKEVSRATSLAELICILRTNGTLVKRDEGQTPFVRFFVRQVADWSKIPCTLIIEVKSGDHSSVVSAYDFCTIDWITENKFIHIFESPVNISDLKIQFTFTSVGATDATAECEILSSHLEDLDGDSFFL